MDAFRLILKIVFNEYHKCVWRTDLEKCSFIPFHNRLGIDQIEKHQIRSKNYNCSQHSGVSRMGRFYAASATWYKKGMFVALSGALEPKSNPSMNDSTHGLHSSIVQHGSQHNF